MFVNNSILAIYQSHFQVLDFSLCLRRSFRAPRCLRSLYSFIEAENILHNSEKTAVKNVTENFLKRSVILESCVTQYLYVLLTVRSLRRDKQQAQLTAVKYFQGSEFGLLQGKFK